MDVGRVRFSSRTWNKDPPPPPDWRGCGALMVCINCLVNPNGDAWFNELHTYKLLYKVYSTCYIKQSVDPKKIF